MGQEHIITCVAQGPIGRCRLVYGSAEFGCLQATSFSHLSFPMLGVSPPHARMAPGTPFDTSLAAAYSGDEVAIHTHGAIALVECGGTVTAGKPLINAGDGTVVNGSVPFSASGYYAGIAREDGTAGKIIRMEVVLFG